MNSLKNKQGFCDIFCDIPPPPPHFKNVSRWTFLTYHIVYRFMKILKVLIVKQKKNEIFWLTFDHFYSL